MPVFPLKLQQTYFKSGFFNVVVEYDRYVRKTDGPIRLRLGRNGVEIEGRIDRTVNRNGTARVLGGIRLRDWFINNFEPMDTVAVDLTSEQAIVLDKP
jgi:hypothetical protein